MLVNPSDPQTFMIFTDRYKVRTHDFTRGGVHQKWSPKEIDIKMLILALHHLTSSLARPKTDSYEFSQKKCPKIIRTRRNAILK